MIALTHERAETDTSNRYLESMIIGVVSPSNLSLRPKLQRLVNLLWNLIFDFNLRSRKKDEEIEKYIRDEGPATKS